MPTPPILLPWSDAPGAEYESVLLDDGALAAPHGPRHIVVASGTEERAGRLLDEGALQVLVGDAALRDGGCIARLAARYGEGRVGLYLPVRRAVASWTLDPCSNADFTCMVSSAPVPRWEALFSDGESAGADAIAWAERMVAAGASRVVFAGGVDPEDLTLAAECVERLGERLWFATRSTAPDLEPWLTLAGARRFVVPPSVIERYAAAETVT